MKCIGLLLYHDLQTALLTSSLVLQLLALLTAIRVNLHPCLHLCQLLQQLSYCRLYGQHIFHHFLRIKSLARLQLPAALPVRLLELEPALNVASMLRRRRNVTSFVSKSTRPDTDSPPHQNWCREHLQKLATSTARFCIENNLEDWKTQHCTLYLFIFFRPRPLCPLLRPKQAQIAIVMHRDDLQSRCSGQES